jgi:dTDP-4-amino-4,6-dideoxygalactose transaminase
VGHILGEPLDMDGIMEVADEYDLPVIEDVAQAHGAGLDGQPLGTFGDVAAFSTMSGKHHATGAQGGIVYTEDEDRYWRARKASDRGKPFGDEADGNLMASLNLNLNDLSAAISRVQLDRLSDIVARRRTLVATIGDRIEGLPGVEIPDLLPGAEPSYWYWRLGVDESALSCDKATFCQALRAEGLPVTTRYDSRPHLDDWFQNQRVFGTSGYPWQAPEYEGDSEPDVHCPNADAVLDRCFNLTVYESWGDAEVDDIVAAFEKIASAYAP